MVAKILLVDDSPTILRLLSSYLTKEGFEVVTATDAGQAFRILRDYIPDVILTDVMMPDMDGYTFLGHLRKNSKYESLPVIVMSSKSKEVMHDLFAFHDISGYLQKPFEKDELNMIIEKVLLENVA